MIDIQFIRENPKRIQEIAKRKNADIDTERIIALDDRRRSLVQELGDTNQARNAAAKEKQIEEGRRLKESAGKTQEALTGVEAELEALLNAVPNLPSDDTPVGTSEEGNMILREVGSKPVFSFEPKEHWELGAHLDLIDAQSAAEVSGSRFAYLKGDLVLLQFALVQLILQTLTDKEKLESIAKKAGLAVKATPFIPVMPPLMMRADVMAKMARLEPRDERYHIESDDAYLIGSAEHTLGPLHMNQILKEEDLPIRYVAHTSAFRREAGTYGKDMKGILRLHQFEKTEMVSFATPEEGMNEHLFMIAIQEHINQTLELPYQVVLKCTGDQGTPDARAVDLETWMPGQGKYRETHTADLMTDYQSRRLKTRVKRADGTKIFVHMNDATAAAGRTLAAILENFQQEDGSIRVPKALEFWMGKPLIR